MCTAGTLSHGGLVIMYGCMGVGADMQSSGGAAGTDRN